MYDKHGHVFWADVCVFIFCLLYIPGCPKQRCVCLFVVVVVVFFFFGGGGLEAPYLPVQFSSCLCVWPTSAQCLMNRWNRGIHAGCAGSGWLRLPVTCADLELLFEGQDQHV